MNQFIYFIKHAALMLVFFSMVVCSVMAIGQGMVFTIVVGVISLIASTYCLIKFFKSLK